MSDVEITLNNTKTYYAGSLVNGTVYCRFNNEKTIIGIKVKCFCKEKTHWRKSSDNYISAENKFLITEFDLMNNERTLPSGIHNYPFSFTLPKNIPSTFKTEYGSIRYKIKVIVKRLRKSDFETEVLINVISPIDLNIIKGIEVSAENSNKINISRCCWKSEPLSMTVKLPRSGYAPGEELNILAHVENLSRSNIRELNFKLFQKIEMKASKDRIKETNFLSEITKEGGIGAHSNYIFALTMLIPKHIILPNFTNCKLFEVSYYLKCKAVYPSLFLSPLSFHIPLTIGHIGLKKYNEISSNIPSYQSKILHQHESFYRNSLAKLMFYPKTN